MASVQMNIRIDDDVKERGDEVFARYGLTSSQVIRAVWQYAEEKGEPPSFVWQRAKASSDVEAEIRRKLALVEKGSRIGEDFFRERGLTFPEPRKIDRHDLKEDSYDGKLRDELDADEIRVAYYEDLRDEAYDETLREMGRL